MLPAGNNATKVSLPQQKIQIPAGASRSQIYSGSDFRWCVIVVAARSSGRLKHRKDVEVRSGVGISCAAALAAMNAAEGDYCRAGPLADTGNQIWVCELPCPEVVT